MAIWGGCRCQRWPDDEPSTEDILAAIQSVPAKTVPVLPNNKNIMASEQAQKPDRKVIVPTRTVPQGMTAMLNFTLT